MEITNLSENSEDFTGNVWLLSDQENILIDAGTGDSWNMIKELEKVDKVVVTHSHHDHVDNLPKIVDRFDPEVFAFEPDNLPVNAEKLDEGREIDLGGVRFRAIHTPGHRNDSICLYSPAEKILFTGDLVFPGGSFGRTDLAEGDREILIESIEKIAELDVEKFYPGHDGSVKEDANDWINKSLEEAKKREPKY